jgi:hypothetical protein
MEEQRDQRLWRIAKKRAAFKQNLYSYIVYGPCGGLHRGGMAGIQAFHGLYGSCCFGE